LEEKIGNEDTRPIKKMAKPFIPYPKKSTGTRGTWLALSLYWKVSEIPKAIGGSETDLGSVWVRPQMHPQDAFGG
jgi:hypothetical protein